MANTDEKKKRVGRTPLHHQKRSRLKSREGFHRHVVRMKDDRIAKFKEAGYEIVYEDVKGDLSSAGTQEGKAAIYDIGGGEKGVLMEIPLKYYNEDQQDKENKDEKVMHEIGYNVKGMIKDVPENLRTGSIKIDTKFE